MPVQAKPIARKHRTLPHRTDAERVILAGMLKDADELIPLLIDGGLCEDDFYHHPHRLCFARMVGLIETGSGACDLVELYQSLRARGELVELPGGACWLAELWETPPCFDGIERWWADGFEYPDVSLFIAAPVAAMRLVRWCAARRATIHAAREAERDAFDGVLGPGDSRLAVWR